MKKKILVVTLIIVLVASLAVGLIGCKDKPGDDLIGFDTDLARAVADKIGVGVEFKLINWNNKEIEIKSGSIDLIWNGMTIRPDRIKEFEMSPGYLNNKQVVVVKKTELANYTSKDVLATKTVSAEAGSAGEDAVQGKTVDGVFDPPVATVKTYVAAQTQIEILTEIKSGAIDAGVMDSTLANNYVTKDGFSDLAVVKAFDLGKEEYGIAAKKGNVSLIDEVYFQIVQLKKDGKLLDIAKTYGLDPDLIVPDTYEKREATDGALKSIKNKGKMVIGYTIFEPISYPKSK
ncbi:MAG: transporter substrate-binding domain-containing protein [Christensenellales bacterium]|jgi:polar amino acid transport system substrate-binding protein|nr:transporter substrate-binding domain-containing protein [Clostridiales bacterium]